MTTKLSIANLKKITGNVEKPSYRSKDLTAGIIHIGIGNFHRAHQSIYLHQLFEQGLDHDWAINGAGVTKYDQLMRSKLEPQDWLTTIVELDPEKLSARITGSMIDYIDVDPHAIIDAMVDPAIRIVSLTVTEGGYYVDAETEGFDQSHADIVADVGHPDSPKTVFGIIIAALIKRRNNGIKPFTVMSCDNLPENGNVAARTILGLAGLIDIDQRDWIAENVAFPNSMVDCITPATSDRELEIVRNTFGIDDSAPVVCEPFHQWVLEDKFSSGRPALEKVGVEFVEDVAPYELMKLRILNGGHASIAYISGLLDIHYVHDAMKNPVVSGFLNKLEHTEIIPTLEEIPGVSFLDYFDKIVERFSNEAVGDTIPRLCFDGFNRQPKFILPVIEDRLAQHQSIEGLALESAFWCRYCYGTTESGAQIPANDPQWGRLNTQAKLAKDDPLQWLELSEVYGPLSKIESFRQSFSRSLNSLWENGVSKTVEQYLN